MLTYDVYERYINPKATDQQLLKVGHMMVAVFAVCMGIAGLIFYYIGVSMGWLYTFMGVLLGSAVVPIALCITWSKANKWGCIGGAISGLVAGLIAWLVTTSSLNNGVINVVTSGQDYEMLAGNLAAIGVGGIVAVVTSLIWPENFDFDVTRNIRAVVPASNFQSESNSVSDDKGDIKNEIKISNYSVDTQTEDEELDVKKLNKAFRFAAYSSLAMLVIMIILIPLPLFFAQTIYTEKGLATWVIIGIIWTFLSAFTVVLYPLWESREALKTISRGIIKDVFTNGSGKYVEAEPKPNSV